MKNFLISDEIDVWVYRRKRKIVEYLLLRASKKKADKWFGVKFWQIPSDKKLRNEKTSKACYRIVKKWTGLVGANAIFTDHISMFYNRRTDAMHIMPAFAVEIVDNKQKVALTWEHDSYKWVSFKEAMKLVPFEGLKSGLEKLKGVAEDNSPHWFLELS